MFLENISKCFGVIDRTLLSFLNLKRGIITSEMLVELSDLLGGHHFISKIFKEL